MNARPARQLDGHVDERGGARLGRHQDAPVDQQFDPAEAHPADDVGERLARRAALEQLERRPAGGGRVVEQDARVGLRRRDVGVGEQPDPALECRPCFDRPTVANAGPAGDRPIG